MWCGSCYQAPENDSFHINHLLDEDGNDIYDCLSDARRYKEGIDGAQFVTTFQCDICIFHLLFKRKPTVTTQDYESLIVIRRLNLDALWSREPTTIASNLRSLSKLISTCEVAGMKPNLPPLGPIPFEDKFGYFVAFSMLVHSKQPGRHLSLYTQFATIRKQRSAFSNLYMAPLETFNANVMLNMGIQSNGLITSCPTNSQWFIRWSLGCETRMGYILKQNQAITTTMLRGLVNLFKEDIKNLDCTSPECWNAVLGFTYSLISYFASLRGNETLKVHYNTLTKYWDKGNTTTSKLIKGSLTPPHVIVPIMGRFKGEQGERCHLLALSSYTSSGFNIRKGIEVLISMRRIWNINSVWLFTDVKGNKLQFDKMNDIFLDKLEVLKSTDTEVANELAEFNIREDFSINRSFRRGSSTAAQVAQVPTDTIELVNRWKKIERATKIFYARNIR